jgi:hypothetical protein
MAKVDDYRRRAAEFERLALNATTAEQARQSRMLAAAWREFSKVVEKRPHAESKTSDPATK